MVWVGDSWAQALIPGMLPHRVSSCLGESFFYPRIFENKGLHIYRVILRDPLVILGSEEKHLIPGCTHLQQTVSCACVSTYCLWCGSTEWMKPQGPSGSQGTDLPCWSGSLLFDFWTLGLWFVRWSPWSYFVGRLDRVDAHEILFLMFSYCFLIDMVSIQTSGSVLDRDWGGCGIQFYLGCVWSPQLVSLAYGFTPLGLNFHLHCQSAS